MQPLLDRTREHLQDCDEGQLPEIDAWRRAYSQMGLKPTKYRCAAESLLRRFKKEDDLPRFHPLVNLCNAFSMAYAIPIAAIDLDHVQEGIEVRYATGDESHLAFSDDIEHPESQEVIFADEGNHAHSRRWCFRQSKQSVIMPSTKRAVIVCEAMHDNGANDVQQLFESLTGSLSAHWSAPSHAAILSPVNPQLGF